MLMLVDVDDEKYYNFFEKKNKINVSIKLIIFFVVEIYFRKKKHSARNRWMRGKAIRFWNENSNNIPD